MSPLLLRTVCIKEGLNDCAAREPDKDKSIGLDFNLLKMKLKVMLTVNI